MKGVYCLLIKVLKHCKIKIGALGFLYFKRGDYVYVGSAQNSIEKRINRHFSSKKKIRWHIDYLLANKNVKLVKAFYKKAGKQEECRIASTLANEGKPLEGFGCSDCKCDSHLIKLKNIKSLSKIPRLKEF